MPGKVIHPHLKIARWTLISESSRIPARTLINQAHEMRDYCVNEIKLIKYIKFISQRNDVMNQDDSKEIYIFFYLLQVV